MFLKWFIILFFSHSAFSNHSVVRRSLLFPRNTVLQFTYGLSVPLVLPRRSINLSFCAQVNYNLPATLASLHTKVISAREKKFDISRETFYLYIVNFLDGVGVEGEACLLRSICEIAEYPLYIKEENLLEKIVHFIFTPSLEFGDQNYNITDNNFPQKLISAEKFGLEKGNCEKEYSECVISIVDLFTSKKIF